MTQAAGRLVVSCLALLWVARSLDLRSTGQALSHVHPEWLGLALLSLLGSAMVAALAWHGTLPPERPSLSPAEAVRVTLIAFAINNVVPAGIAGEAYRLHACLRRGLGVTTGVLTLYLDRWCSLVVLVIALITVTIALGTGALAATPLAGGFSLAKLLAPCALALGALLSLATAAIWIPTVLPRRLLEALARHHVCLEELAPMALAFWRAPARAVRTLALASGSLLLEACSVLACALSVGATQPAAVFMALAPILRVVHRSPGFANGVGAQEVATVSIWGCMGVPAEMAFSISLLLHGIRVGVGLIGLPLYLATPASEAVPPRSTDSRSLGIPGDPAHGRADHRPDAAGSG